MLSNSTKIFFWSALPSSVYNFSATLASTSSTYRFPRGLPKIFGD